jgi:hypothetical protein
MYTNFDKWNQVVKTKCWTDKFYKIPFVFTRWHRLSKFVYIQLYITRASSVLLKIIFYLHWCFVTQFRYQTRICINISVIKITKFNDLNAIYYPSDVINQVFVSIICYRRPACEHQYSVNWGWIMCRHKTFFMAIKVLWIKILSHYN